MFSNLNYPRPEQRFHKSFPKDFLIFEALFVSFAVKSWGCEMYFSPTNSGHTLNRYCPNVPARADLGLTTVWCSKASSGFSKPARAGRICLINIPVPARAGGVCACGKRMGPGSKFGGNSFRSWTRKDAWTGASHFWMAVLLQLKRGRLRWKNQARQRHEVDGGGRRQRYSSGKQTGVGQPGGSDPRRANAGAHSGAARRSGPPAQSTFASRGRQSLRQRSTALALAQTRHRLDQPAPTRAKESFSQRRSRTSSLPQTLQSGTDLRMAGKLSPIARPLRS